MKNNEERLQGLWKRAEALDAEISALKEETGVLFQQCELAQRGKIPCARLEELETSYWEAMREIEIANGELNELLGVIEVAETTGQFPRASQLDTSVSGTEVRRLSKRKRAIEAQKRKEPAPDGEALFIEWFYGSTPNGASVPNKPLDGRIIRTGRRATNIKGCFNADEAVGAFYNATADTHGGKVRGGSRAPAGCYVTASGKRVRKY